MSCQIGIDLLVKEKTKDKAWFNYDEDNNFIHILESPAKRITEYNIGAVARDVANSFNKALNKEYEVGNVFYPIKDNSKVGVKIRPSAKQLEILNAKDAEEAEKIRQEAINDHPELFFKEEIEIEPKDEEKAEQLRIEQEEKNLQYSLRPKNEVERILTEGDIQLRNLVQNIPTEINKTKAPQVIAKMKQILDIIGVKMEIATLPEEVAAQADILNRLIQFADDSITEDNFTEETIHFIVEILEQKDKALYDKLASEIRSYPIYTQVLKEYSELKEYQTAKGTPDYAKLKKEAIGQLLTQKLLNIEEIKEGKNFIDSAWNTISAFIKNLFYKIPFTQRDSFSKLANDILNNPSLIAQEDVQYLGQPSVLFSKKTKNKLVSSVYKAKKAFGKKSTNLFNEFETAEQAFQYFKDLNDKITKVVEQEKNPTTGEMEDVEYYLFEGNKKQRVTSIIKQANTFTFSNISQEDSAKALREAKRQKGTDVHQTIEDILNRYINEATGELRITPLDRPLNYSVPKEAYNRLENHVINRLNSYPKNTKFLMETKVVNEEQGYAGTIDFLAFLPTGQVDILDWKTTDVNYWEAGQKRKRFDISPFNQTYWKTQLNFYKRALESHGIDNFRYTRAIPIAMETKQTLIDKSKKATVDNVIYEITNLEVGDSNPKNIKKDQFYLVPVSSSEESTGIEQLDNLVSDLQGIYQRIQTTSYKKEEAYKKKQELDRLNLAIREIQTKRTATMFTNLFSENFERFERLSDKKFDFLENIKGKRLLLKEQENELHSYLNEIYSAIEFLNTFENFPGVIGELYKEAELTDYEKEVKKAAVSIGGKSQTIAKLLENNAIDIMDKLGQLYDIDKTSAEDNNNIDSFSDWVSILHRQEGSIQFAARLINVIKFLGNQESKKFFDESDGKFTLVFNSVQEWMKKNKKSMDEVYSLLLNKDENGKPLRELLSKIKSEYFKELSEKQKEFTEFFKEQQDTLAEIGYKGDRYIKELKKQYKNHINSWAKSNFNLEEYEKAYKEAYDKYVESNKNVRLDEDDILNEEKKVKRLQNWVDDHDIYSSPKALSTKNYILYNTLNEEKWHSEGYKNLLKPSNKALLDAYNLFTELNKRAEDNGMLDDVFNTRRWVPNLVDSSIKKIAFTVLKDGFKAPFYAISKAASFVLKHINFIKDIEAIEPTTDPLTGKILRRIPVKYKYLKEGEEQDLSNDLFKIYSKWADHIIKYEMLSNYENRFKMIQLLESIKEKSNLVDSKGNIVKKKDSSGQPTLEYQLTPKQKSIEDDLEKIINTYVYSTTLDIKPEYYKLANLLYDYTAYNFLGINITAWLANLAGASVSARLTEGKWFNKNDYATVGINTTLGIFNKNMPKYGDDLYGKSKFLINKLDTRILSEYDKDVSDKFSKSKIKAGDAAFFGFRLGDHFIQDALASSIFLNTTIVNGKFVNIMDLVKAKYNPKIFNTNISSKERNTLRKQRDKEIEDLKKSSNLYRFIEYKNGKYTIKGIDLNTIEGQTELLNYQNLIAHYIKQAIGNIDEFDKSISRMNWYNKFFMQFKNWMPRVIGSRFQSFEYQYELNDYHYGRARIFLNAFNNNFKESAIEAIKELVKVIPFVDRKTNSINLIKLAKSQYLEKKLEALNKNKPFNLTEDQFVDIYINGFKNQMTELSNLVQFGLAVTFIGMSYAGSDDKDKWYWKLLSRTLFKIDRELNFAYSPEQAISFFSKGVFPVLGSLAQLVNVVGNYKNEVIGDIEQQFGIEGAEEKSKKARPISETIKATPVLRELHYWLSAISEDYSDFMEIQQPKVDLEN